MEEWHQRALDGYEKVLGFGDTMIPKLDTIYSLGCLYQDQGKLTKAEEWLQRALDGYVEVLGTGHTHTLDTANNLRDIYNDLGKIDEAERLYQQFSDAAASSNNSDDTDNELDNLCGGQGELVDSERSYREYPDAAANIYDPGPYWVGGSRSSNRLRRDEHPSTIPQRRSLFWNLKSRFKR